LGGESVPRFAILIGEVVEFFISCSKKSKEYCEIFIPGERNNILYNNEASVLLDKTPVTILIYSNVNFDIKLYFYLKIF